MALAVALRIDFIDAKGDTSFTKIRVPSGFSIAQYLEFGAAMCQFISDTSQCLITGASLTFGIDLSGLGLKVAAASVADVFQKGYFAFTSAATGFFKRFRVPTFDEDLVTANSDAIDTVDADVAAFIAANTNGIVVTGTTVQPTTERGHDLTGLSEAREVFRKHNGG
jgi:hypothetical protein